MKEIHTIVDHHATIALAKDQQEKRRNQQNEYIAQRNRYLKYHPPVQDPRTTTQRMEDDILQQYTKRRYRGPSGY